MKVSFFTLGCRSNVFDTQLMAQKFMEKGYKLVEFEDVADVYIINTCTVTHGADRSSRQAIYQAKRRNKNAIVVATGCYAQTNPNQLAHTADLVIGNTHKHQIIQILEEYMERKTGKVYVGEVFRMPNVEFDLVTYFEKSRPFLKVQEGCNKFCTFCVIPFARGKCRSVPMEKVVEEAKALASLGFEEIVLSGTQLTQYGWDINTSLYNLLKELVKIEGLKLIRLSSLYPSEIDANLLELIVSEEKIAPHFHLSLQSGSDRILKLMDRRYTVKDYVSLIDKILSKRPLANIGTDVIVGFPTESQEDFEQTYNLIKDLPLGYLHIFPYSDRPNTKASKLNPKVPEKVKKQRVHILKELDKRKREEFYEKNLNQTLRATVLTEDKVLTENYIQLNLSIDEKPGKVVNVRLESLEIVSCVS